MSSDSESLRQTTTFLPTLARDLDLRFPFTENLGRTVPRKMKTTMFKLYSGAVYSCWELVGKDVAGKGRTKKLLMGGAVLLAILVIIGLTVGLQSKQPNPRSEASTDTRLLRPHGTKTGNITLDQNLSLDFSPSGFNGTWISDTELIYMDVDKNVVLMDVPSQSSRILISTEALSNYRLMDYRMSPDKKYMMLIHDAQKLYRYSFLARYSLYEFSTKEIHRLQVTDSQRQDHLHLAIWSPSGSSLAFVHANDVYYRQSPKDITLRLTTTGVMGQQGGPVYNGVADWVYEEEVLNTNKALWFSPDGKKIAFATFNDTLVDHIQFPFYGPFIPDNKYPHITSIPYPKPGTNNPFVYVSVFDFENQQIVELPPPDEFRDYYFTAVAWANNDAVTVMWLNRTQNLAYLYKYDAPKYEPNQIRKFSSPDGWLSVATPPKFSPDGESYLMILPVDVGDDSWPHIVQLDTKTGTQTSITHGKFTVKTIKHWDQKNNIIYYRSSTEGKTGERHIYKTTAGSSPECITCGRKNFNADPCLYNNGHFSKSASFVTISCQGPYTVTKTTVEEVDSGKVMVVWEENKDIQEKMDVIPELKIFKTLVPVKSGFKARVNILLPLDFDETADKKYPIVVYTYGGPNSQIGTDAWRGVDWGAVLASHGIAYVEIDGRGSGYMGNNLLFQIYRKLGTVEVEDQIDVTKKLIEQYSWIDPSRVGIWGWSYGGYVTGRVLATDTKNIFKCGISVAPVTSWLLYDSIYTERYMGLPYKNDNFDMYNNTDIIQHAEGLRHKNFYLIHGNADENVHYQQSMFLSKRLEHLDILFRQQSYPDEGHGLSFVRRHLYHSMQNFWLECFDLA